MNRFECRASTPALEVVLDIVAHQGVDDPAFLHYARGALQTQAH
jgi:hypothetical protein